jgi:hypothetical protein
LLYLTKADTPKRRACIVRLCRDVRDDLLVPQWRLHHEDLELIMVVFPRHVSAKDVSHEASSLVFNFYRDRNIPREGEPLRDQVGLSEWLVQARQG